MGVLNPDTSRALPESSISVPQCAIPCIREHLQATGCRDGDWDCFCREDSLMDLVHALSTCSSAEEGCSYNSDWSMGATYDNLCDLVKTETAYEEDPTAHFDHKIPSSHENTPDLKVRRQVYYEPQNPNRDCPDLPLGTKIGMAVGFSVAGLLIIVLLCLYMRERRLRKNFEMGMGMTKPMRQSRVSQKTGHTSYAPKKESPKRESRKSAKSTRTRHTTFQSYNTTPPTLSSDSAALRPSQSGTPPTRPVAAELA